MVIRAVEVTIKRMEHKITNTFIEDENLADKYNARLISERLIRKRGLENCYELDQTAKYLKVEDEVHLKS